MSKVLVTGALGMLGHYILKHLSKSYQLTGWDIADAKDLDFPYTVETIDLIDFATVNREIKRLKPEIVIHTAAMINVDQCQLEPEKSRLFNSQMTSNLANAVNIAGGKMIYISTDAVFDGDKDGAYREEDAVNPLNVYGHHKLAAEKAVLSLASKNVVLRTNIYGWNIQNKMSAAESILASLQQQKALNMFTDVIFTPIYVGHFTDFIAAIIDKKLSGLLHVAGGEHCSKHEFAMQLAKVFELETSSIHQALQKDIKLPAKRNKNMRLDSSKFAKLSGKQLPGLLQGLESYRKDAKLYGKYAHK